MSPPVVLFDAPGPRARRRHGMLTVVGVVIAGGGLVVILRKMAAAQQLQREQWTPFLSPEAWLSYLVPGLWGTAQAAVLAVAFAGVFGLVFGVGRLSANRAIRWPSAVVVEFFRAVPVLIMIIFAFGVYTSNAIFPVDLNPLAAVVTGLTLYNGAVIAELVRSGVHTLPRGQTEAGLSVGLSDGQVLRLVQIPQALTAMLPALVGQLVVVLKDSALGYAITYQELLSWAKTLGSAYANTVPAYLVAAALFIAINFALTWFAGWLQVRLARRGARPVDPVAVLGQALPEGVAPPNMRKV